jgi:hypothetical protein
MTQQVNSRRYRHFLALFPGGTFFRPLIDHAILTSHPFIRGLRSVFWKFYLIILPELTSPFLLHEEWSSILLSKRQQYATFVKPSNLDERTLTDISVDVERIPNEDIYSADSPNRLIYAEAIRDLCHHFLGQNPGLQYIQGFHDIFAVVYHLFYKESRCFRETNDAFSLILTRSELNADVFWAGSAILKALIDSEYYKPGELSTTSGAYGRVFRNLDRELQGIIQYVHPSLFVAKWARLFFMDEYHLKEVQILWSRILTFWGRPNLIDNLVFARFQAVRQQILEIPELQATWESVQNQMETQKGILVKNQPFEWLSLLEEKALDPLEELSKYEKTLSEMWATKPKEVIAKELRKIGQGLLAIELLNENRNGDMEEWQSDEDESELPS